ncbi:MAG: hypothetical protein U1E50_16475 [Caulobacteraceae bacterium]
MRKFIATAFAVAGLAAATQAAAADTTRMTDQQFVAAARCRGLAGSDALGRIDTTTIDAAIKASSRNRPQFVSDAAAKARDDAERQARRADEAGRTRLTAERDALCTSVQQFGGGNAGVMSTARTPEAQ